MTGRRAMSELVLLTEADSSDPRFPRFYALLHLNEANVRWLREMLDRAQGASKESPGFVGFHLRFPDGLFFEDPTLATGGGPYGEFSQTLRQNRGGIVPRRDVPDGYFVPARSEVLIQNAGFFWEIPGDVRFTSSFVLDGVIARAWCLVCPPIERARAFVNLIQLNPDQAVDWLEAGAMCSDDGSVRVPLPSLSPELLVPLLESRNAAIRERTLMTLGRRLSTPPAPTPGVPSIDRRVR